MELTVEKKYQLLLDISQRVRDTLDLDKILSLLLDTVYSVMPFDAAGIFVLNQDIVYGQEDRPQGVIAGIVLRGFEGRPVEDDPMRNLGHGIIGHVIRTRECVVAPDVRLDSHYVEGRKATLSEIAVPILRSDRAIGALNLESDRLGAFEASDVEVLQFFADAAAISIEKAMLHRQLIEKELIDQQLRLAREVQSLLFPREAPQVNGYDIAGICIPTEQIGGDYFDFVPLADNQLGIGVADVSGHGIAPALVMTAFRALLRTFARSRDEPPEIAAAINRLLPEFTGDRHFVTAIYAILDPQNHQFTFSSCGHPHPMLLHANGSLEILGENGPALGIFEKADYPAGKASLAPGDLLALYTDGVVEITNAEGEQFRPERLANVLRRKEDPSAEEVIQEIVRETKAFSGLDSYLDDFTLVIIKSCP